MPNSKQSCKLRIRYCGVVPYEKALALQKNLLGQRQKGTIDNTILILEHAPVITLGARDSENRLLIAESVLNKKGIELVSVRRGGGGASLRNPGEQFVPGDDLELILNPAGDGTPARAGRINLTAEVVRVSRKAQVLHVRFDGLQESTRDRIIGALFKAAARTPADRSTPASFESKEK